MKIGITFDYEQCEHLGLSYKKTLCVITQLNIPIVRIGLKWSKVEVEKDKFHWEIYDDILQYLDKNHIEVILCMGMKSPRWPEFFIPDWLDFKRLKDFKVLSSNVVLQKRLFTFLEKAVKRYSDLKCVKSIQLENEPFLKAGPRKGRISQSFLTEELSYLKTLTKLPIVLNAQALPTTGVITEYIKNRHSYKKKLIKLCDAFGMNVYQSFEGRTIGGLQKTFKAKAPAWKYLESLINLARKYKKQYLVTELQAEPWEFGKVSLEDAYANRTCNPKMVLNNIQKLKNLGLETILLWGFEFHVACLQKGNDEWVKLLYKH